MCCISRATDESRSGRHRNRMTEEILLTTGMTPVKVRKKPHSAVVPIPKRGKKPDRLTHLGPISLTSVLCKLSERMVLPRISYHLETTGWFNLPDWVLFWLIYARTTACTDIGRPLNFIKCFLAGRTFEVLTPGNKTRPYCNAVGVPQGAIISPTPFDMVMVRLTWQLEDVD
ncbi:hypothetical protein HPB49_011849 [Dermacentor silvarum]|uniref:Uncharacterized protein n=1 Tax=Dermacentor silvarum TaxID=543639 RepID=A0ACB8D5L1_DERSI|nr:hypothetical protein HPB49_011849 [Dermacentor silvarum]